MAAQQVANGRQRLAISWLTRFPSHLRREGRQLGLLVLGHFSIFILALGHDEILAECVASGLIDGAQAQSVELIISLVLFLLWAALTIAITRIVARARADALWQTRRHP